MIEDVDEFSESLAEIEAITSHGDADESESGTGVFVFNDEVEEGFWVHIGGFEGDVSGLGFDSVNIKMKVPRWIRTIIPVVLVTHTGLLNFLAVDESLHNFNSFDSLLFVHGFTPPLHRL